MKLSLPIDELLPNLEEQIINKRVIIVKATPGSGKTTRIPPFLGQILDKKILVLEPRRIAARLSAERIASEMGGLCGDFVGYHVRYDKNTSDKTKVVFVTEGMILRYLLSSPLLAEFSCVILDEFHERHLHSDFAYALIRFLQKTLRPDLRLLIMSATINLSDLQNSLPDAGVIESFGRVFPVNLIYKEINPRLFLSQNVADAIENLFVNSACSQHILAFLPGAFEIKRTAAELEEFAKKNNAVICELRGELPFTEQQKAFSDFAGKRKIVLATNVAETSITIEGVTGVVDCGLAKIASFASWSGLPTLSVKAVSKSACEQRAGRAGRTAAGVAVRLFAKYDFEARPATEKPEILRSELSQAMLDFLVIRDKYPDNLFPDFEHLPWIDKPPPKHVASGLELLLRLNAVDSSGVLTEIGKSMANFSLHPRLSRIIVEAKKQNIFELGVIAVGLLSEGMLLKRQNKSVDVGDSDLEYQVGLYLSLQQKMSINSEIYREIDLGKVRRIEAFVKIFVNRLELSVNNIHNYYEKLSLCLFKAFPDRVAVLRKQKRGDMPEYNLCAGGGGVLDVSSIVHDSKYIIALDAEENPVSGNQATGRKIISAHTINEAILLDDSAEMLSESTENYWDSEAKKVITSQKIRYGELVIDETSVSGSNAECENILLSALKKDWRVVFSDFEYLEQFDARIKFCNDQGLKYDFLLTNLEGFYELLSFICEKKKSYAQVKEKSLKNYVAEFLDYNILMEIDKLSPEKVVIGKGKSVAINYSLESDPWIAARMQDFFGCSQTPKIFNQKIPLVVHLLAPNKQALQVTRDLKSFWDSAYPVLKKEYARRYPRHYWPENPLEATPPEPGKLRPK